MVDKYNLNHDTGRLELDNDIGAWVTILEYQKLEQELDHQIELNTEMQQANNDVQQERDSLLKALEKAIKLNNSLSKNESFIFDASCEFEEALNGYKAVSGE